MRVEIFCTLEVQGLHKWPAAPKDVFYLAHPHRHVFKIKCSKPVAHDDRDTEFILLKNAVLEHFRAKYDQFEGVYDFGSLSCEMIARALVEKFDLSSCTVSEDGENGATVWR